MKRNPQDLEKIAHLTLEHYNKYAEEFWRGHAIMTSARTSRHYCNTFGMNRLSKSSILAAGLGATSRRSPNSVAIGLEGAEQLAVRARAHSGCEVWQQDFLKLDLPENYFDGVFANAALFHVPSQVLPRVLLELKASLKPGGVLFSSNPRGHNEEGWSQGRYGVYHDLDAWRRY